MSTSLSTVTTPIVSSSSPDQRNLQWKSSNIGAKLLGKMGWKDGQAVGKRQRSAPDGDGQQESSFSSEGLRIKKRTDGLGVGADKSMSAQALGGNEVHKEFASVLAALNEHSTTPPTKASRKSKKGTKSLSLPTNKTTCHKVRRAKFQEKTAEDMKCIFGSSSIDFPVVVSSSGESTAMSGDGDVEKKKTKRKSKNDDDRKRSKKKKSKR